MPSELQYDLFADRLTAQQKFDLWKTTPFGAEACRMAYAITAREFAPWCLRYRVKASIKHVYEKVRWYLVLMTVQRRRLKVGIEKLDGFMLNNNMTPYLARHIMDRRKDWAGIFDVKEVGKVRRKKKIIVIEETQKAA